MATAGWGRECGGHSAPAANSAEDYETVFRAPAANSAEDHETVFALASGACIGLNAQSLMAKLYTLA